MDAAKTAFSALNGERDAATPALLGALAYIHYDLGDDDAAFSLAIDAVVAFAPDDPDTLTYASAQQLLALLFEQRGDEPAAHHARLDAISRLKVRLGHLGPADLAEQAMHLGFIGKLHLQAEDAEQAIPYLRTGVETLRELAADQPGTYRAVLGADLFQLSEALEAAEELEASTTAAHEAASIFRDLAARGDARSGEELAVVLASLGNTLARLGRIDDARAVLEEALQRGTARNTEFRGSELWSFITSMLDALRDP